jgi:hypothetical protein
VSGNTHQLGRTVRQPADDGGAVVVGPAVDPGPQRDPALDQDLGRAVVQAHPLPLAPVGVREAVRVRGERTPGVARGRADQVGAAVGSVGGDGHQVLGPAAEQQVRGVEEVDAVLDEDAAAALLVPEPVLGRQVLVARVVLEREALHRAEQLVTKDDQRLEDRVVAQDVVDDQGAAVPACRVDDLPGPVHGRRERLLAEDVPPCGQGRQRDGGMGRRGCRHDDGVDFAVVDERRPVARRLRAVTGGQPGRARSVRVGDRTERDLRQVGRHRSDEPAEAARSDQTQPERRRHVCSSLATPIRESAMP